MTKRDYSVEFATYLYRLYPEGMTKREFEFARDEFMEQKGGERNYYYPWISNEEFCSKANYYKYNNWSYIYEDGLSKVQRGTAVPLQYPMVLFDGFVPTRDVMTRHGFLKKLENGKYASTVSAPAVTIDATEIQKRLAELQRQMDELQRILNQ